jgi:hypothetical protein
VSSSTFGPSSNDGVRRVLGFMRRFSRLVLLALATGCVPIQWNREKIEPKRLGRRHHVKIWSADSVLRWHAVVITSDSLTGVPTGMSSKCDSCRLGLPRYAVDSIRVREPASPRESVALTVLLYAYGLGHLRRADPH